MPAITIIIFNNGHIMPEQMIFVLNVQPISRPTKHVLQIQFHVLLALIN